MLHYLVTAGNDDTILPLIQHWVPRLQSVFAVMPYPALIEHTSPQSGAYVFSDLERLNGTQTTMLGELHSGLAINSSLRLVNDPSRSLRRLELLAALADHGINAFRAYRLDEASKPWRFPVFLRLGRSHAGALSGLIRDQAALDARVAYLLLAGADREDLIVTEYLDTSDSDGVFRKYAAFRVGDEIIPRHVLFSRRWMLKEEDLLEQTHIEEILGYTQANPHEDELRRIFELAQIEYGRIDYSLLEDRLQVWEINTNPTVLRPPIAYRRRTHGFHEAFAQRIAAAFLQLCRA